MITVVSKANPGDSAVVLHGQGTALPTLEVFGGDIRLLLLYHLAIRSLLLVPFELQACDIYCVVRGS